MLDKADCFYFCIQTTRSFSNLKKEQITKLFKEHSLRQLPPHKLKKARLPQFSSPMLCENRALLQMGLEKDPFFNLKNFAQKLQHQSELNLRCFDRCL